MNEKLLFSSRVEFREWLINNHADSKGVWLIFGKGGKLQTISPEEALSRHCALDGLMAR